MAKNYEYFVDGIALTSVSLFGLIGTLLSIRYLIQIHSIQKARPFREHFFEIHWHLLIILVCVEKFMNFIKVRFFIKSAKLTLLLQTYHNKPNLGLMNTLVLLGALTMVNNLVIWRSCQISFIESYQISADILTRLLNLISAYSFNNKFKVPFWNWKSLFKECVTYL